MTLSQFLYWAIIAFIVADFGIGLWLTLLNAKASKWPVPKVLEGLYDDEKYRKQQAYASEFCSSWILRLPASSAAMSSNNL